MQMLPPSPSSKSSSSTATTPSQSPSIDSHSIQTSPIHDHIESMRQRMAPIMGDPNQNTNVDRKKIKPVLKNLDNSPSTRKPTFNLPISSPQPSVDLTSKEIQAKYDEVLQNSGLFLINGERKLIEQKDIVKQCLLGSGTCGEVFKMRHEPSQMILAVKVMFRTQSHEENKRIIMDLDVLVKSYNFPHIVRCFGYFIQQTDVWIGMELMASCFDKLLKRIQQPIPEYILGKLTFSTVTALNYLKQQHGIMHRDVKPSNILIDENGNIKLCDFGICGILIDSKANSRNAGCVAYTSPERINPTTEGKPNYDIRADIWSLGISLIELATNTHPYANGKTDFDIMARIVEENSPQLPSDVFFSDIFRSFVDTCLIKNYQDRPKYGKLMEQPFFIHSTEQSVDVANWYRTVTSAASQK